MEGPVRELKAGEIKTSYGIDEPERSLVFPVEAKWVLPCDNRNTLLSDFVQKIIIPPRGQAEANVRIIPTTSSAPHPKEQVSKAGKKISLCTAVPELGPRRDGASGKGLKEGEVRETIWQLMNRWENK